MTTLVIRLQKAKPFWILLEPDMMVLYTDISFTIVNK